MRVEIQHKDPFHLKSPQELQHFLEGFLFLCKNTLGIQWEL